MSKLGVDWSVDIPRLERGYENEKNYSTIASSLKTYFGQQQAKFIAGELDVEKDWDKFQTELKNLKIEECLKLAQKGYDYMER